MVPKEPAQVRSIGQLTNGLRERRAMACSESVG